MVGCLFVGGQQRSTLTLCNNTFRTCWFINNKTKCTCFLFELGEYFSFVYKRRNRHRSNNQYCNQDQWEFMTHNWTARERGERTADRTGIAWGEPHRKQKQQTEKAQKNWTLWPNLKLPQKNLRKCGADKNGQIFGHFCPFLFFDRFSCQSL